MAQKPLQGIEFPGLTDEYMIPVVDGTLTQAGAAADAKKTGDELDGLKNDFTQLDDAIFETFSETGTRIRHEGVISNPVSITGEADGENVYVTSANLFDISLITDREGLLVNHGTYLTVTQNSSGDRVNCLKKVSELCPQLKIGDVVYLKADTTGTNKYVYFNLPSLTVNFGTYFTVTQNILDSYFYFLASGAGTSADISNIMVCFAVTDEYEPYNSEVYADGTTTLENDVNYIFGSAGSSLTLTYKISEFSKVDELEDYIISDESKSGSIVEMKNCVAGTVSVSGATSGDTIYVGGRNLFNYNAIPTRAGYITNNGDGTYTVDNTSGTADTVNTLHKLSEICPGLRNGDVAYLTMESTSSAQGFYLSSGDSWSNNTRKTISTAMLGEYVYLRASAGETATISNVQVWFGNVAGDYEPWRTKSFVFGTDDITVENGFNRIWDSAGSTITVGYKKNRIESLEDTTGLVQRYSGKKMLVLGDSISASNYLGYPAWCVGVSDRLSMELTNASVHAVGYLCGVDSPTPGADSLVNLIDTLHTQYPNKDDFDLIVFFRGTNDYGNGITMGETGDESTESFIGAVEYCFRKAYQYWADARKIVLTPMPRKTGDTANTAGKKLSDYVDAIIEAAHKIGYPVLNLYTDSGFNVAQQVFGQYVTTDGTSATDTQFALDYCLYYNNAPDGLHPNKKYTDEWLAPQIEAFIHNV